jgi:uncharacterized protein (DUF302 family)
VIKGDVSNESKKDYEEKYEKLSTDWKFKGCEER